MSETDLIERLRARRDGLQVGLPPVVELRTKIAAKRRRRAVLTVAALSALAVSGVLAAAAIHQSPASEVSRPALSPDQPTDLLSESAMIGVGELTIHVPADWTRNDEFCGVPMSDTVLSLGDATRMCAHPRPDDVTAVSTELMSAPRAADWLQRTTRIEELNGVSVRVGEYVYPEDVYGHDVYVSVLVSPAHDAAFRIESPDPDLADQIWSTVATVPAGSVVVPRLQGMPRSTAESTLEELGLVADGSAAMTALTVDSEPTAGAVVADGTGIRLLHR